jgi:hypothetical protein
MKISTLLLFILPFTIHAQKIEKQVIKSTIDEVKLYLTAGQMIHDQKVSLKKGRNKLIFSGISAYADPASIQFNAEGNYRLVSVSTEMDFLAAEEFNPKISELKDTLEFLKDEHQANKDVINSYDAEIAVMNMNKDLGGSNENLSVAQIREAATYYRTRTLEINKALTKLRKRQRQLNEQIEATRFQLVELNYNENQRSNQVIILLDTDSELTTDSRLKYLVSDCGWAATYDLSAQDLQQQINLKYKAQVYNNTGNDWKNVKLTLSTGDPHLSASHPEMSPWYLNTYNVSKLKNKGYYAPQVVQHNYRDSAIFNINIANQRAYDNYYLERDLAGNQFGIYDNKTILRNQVNVGKQSVKMREIDISELTTEFEIESIFSCPSDSKPYLVDVKEMNLDATFSHITVPKLDKSAFLLAHIVGWQELELIPGPTNVYFGGLYVGVSQIETRNVSDTLSLSFGRDNKVVVMRKLKKEFSTKRVVGNTKKESYLYEIAVRNNRSVPIDIEIYDQIPISKSNMIDVTVDELSDGSKHDETGEVKWKLKLETGQVSSREIGYSVKYPKNMNVSVRRFRTVSSPSF